MTARRPDDHHGLGCGAIWLLLDSRQVGGIESHVAQLAGGLVAAGLRVEVVLYADHGPHPLRATLDRERIPHRTLAGTIPGLLAALRCERPAIVHTHGYKAGVLGRLLARALGIPVVSTYHSGEPGAGRLRLYLAIDRATARFGHPIAVSESIQERLPSTATLIENFVDLPSALPIGKRSDTVAFVGRLSDEKGPDEFCILADELPDIPFAVYGDGPMRRELEARHGARVRFHGAVPGMAGHWRDVGLLCMPSRAEGLPMAALEALAHGIPVAAYAVGALPRCVQTGRTGWLAARGDRRQLRDAIGAWREQTDAKAATMALAARGLIEQQFSLDVGTRHVLGVYARAGLEPRYL